MVVVDCGYAQEHEDDRFRRSTQHLHGILQRRLRVGRDVPLDVVLAGDAAECNSKNHEKNVNKQQGFNT